MSNMYRSWLALGLLAVALLLVACDATDGEPLAEGDPARGRNLWSESPCAGCHGIEAAGSTAGPALVDTPLSLRDVINITRRGTPGMPEYPESQIGDLDLRDMYAWFQNPVPAPTPELAQSPWTASSCAGCHGVNAQGGSGPGLAGTSLPIDAFEAVVRRGARGMPAYSPSELGDAELRRLYDWLHAQAQLPAEPGDQWTEMGCAGCHGPDAGGGSAPALTDEDLSYDEFQRVVRGGAEGMPAYSPSQIRDPELQLMFDWLQERAQALVEPHTAWVEAGCGGCHGATAEGGIAPSLTGEHLSYDEFHRVVRGGARGMPAYGPSQISDAELDLVYNWLSEAP